MELEKEMKINPNQQKGGNKKDYNRDIKNIDQENKYQ